MSLRVGDINDNPLRMQLVTSAARNNQGPHNRLVHLWALALYEVLLGVRRVLFERSRRVLIGRAVSRPGSFM